MNTQDKEVAETYALQLIARDPSRLDYALEVAPGSDLVREEFVEKKLAMLQQSDSRRPAASQDDLQLTARKLFEIAPTREDVQKVFIDFVVRFMRPEEVVSTIPDALHFNAACKELYFERVCGMKFTDASPDSHYSLALGLAKVGKARTLSNRLRNAYVDLIFQHVPYRQTISLYYMLRR